jgi:transposase InsO family protein
MSRSGREARAQTSKVMSPNGAQKPAAKAYKFTAEVPPGTDGSGDQNPYKRAVLDWCALHDQLLLNDAKKKIALTKAERGLALKGQLSGAALAKVNTIPISDLVSNEGVTKMLDILVTETPGVTAVRRSKRVTALLAMNRHEREPLSDFITKYIAEYCRLKTESYTKLDPQLEEVIALKWLEACRLEASLYQQVLIAATTEYAGKHPNSSTMILDMSTMQHALELIPTKDSQRNRFENTAQSHYGSTDQSSRSDKIQERKRKTKCRACGETGHWAGDAGCKKSKEGVAANTNAAGSAAAQASGEKQVSTKLGETMISSLVIPSFTANTTEKESFAGLIVDSGAPVSLIGKDTLFAYDSTAKILPGRSSDPQFHRFGPQAEGSKTRRFIGRTNMTINKTFPVSILVVEGSAPGIIGNDVLKHFSLNFVKQQLEGKDGENIPVSMEGGHVVVSCFTHVSSFLDYSEIGQKILSFHRKTHAPYSTIKRLLIRAGEWNDSVTEEEENELKSKLESCENCVRSGFPQPVNKVSLSQIDMNFNQSVSVDFVYLDRKPVFHMICNATGYSEVVYLGNTSKQEAATALETEWIYRHGTPEILKYDVEFHKPAFTKVLKKHGIQAVPLPSRKHQKNGVIERKHREIRKYFVRLQESAGRDPNVSYLAKIATYLSNITYGNRVLSPFEQARGYTPWHAYGEAWPVITRGLKNKERKRQAREKYRKVSRARGMPQFDKFEVGDEVLVWVREGKGRGNWLEYEISEVLENGVQVGEGKGKRYVAFEDVKRLDESESETGASPMGISQRWRDPESDSEISSSDSSISSSEKDSNTSDSDESDLESLSSKYRSTQFFEPRGAPSHFMSSDIPEPTTHEPEDSNKRKRNDQGSDDDELDKHEQVTASFPGLRRSLRRRQKTQRLIESMLLDTTSYIHDLQAMFGCHPFTEKQAELSGSPSWVFLEPLQKEMDKWKGKYTKVKRTDIPKHANVIGSHILYGIKEKDSGDRELKARLVIWGHVDKDKDKVPKETVVANVEALRFILAMSVIKKWSLFKVDVKGAFLQSGDSPRDVYVRVPKSVDNDSMSLWHLNVLAYGLVDAPRQWQLRSDKVLSELGFESSKIFPQVFYKQNIILIKYVDDILGAALPQEREVFIESFGKQVQLGTTYY